MEVAATDLAELMGAAAAAHQRMWTSASRMTDDSCRAPSLLPGWSRGHVLAHWARNADGQTRMLQAAMSGEVAAQYPGGDAERAADIEIGADRSPHRAAPHLEVSMGAVAGDRNPPRRPGRRLHP